MHAKGFISPGLGVTIPVISMLVKAQSMFWTACDLIYLCDETTEGIHPITLELGDSRAQGSDPSKMPSDFQYALDGYVSVLDGERTDG